MPFGVELPADLGNSPSSAPSGGGGDNGSNAPSGAAPDDTSSPKGASTETTETPTAKELLDLDKLERFRFQGREWSPKDLQRAHMLQQDYSRKTAELAETRKYVDNFAIDLAAVKADKSLLDRMRQIYPREFVEYAERILGEQTDTRTTGQQTHQDPNRQIDPEVAEIKKQFSEIKAERERQQVEAIQGWLDNQHATLGKKYPNAISEIVDARATIFANQGGKVTGEILEKLYKAVDKEISERQDRAFQEKVKKQVKVGKDGRDMGAGGGTPTSAPRNPKTFKEAREMMIQDLEVGKSRF